MARSTPIKACDLDEPVLGSGGWLQVLALPFSVVPHVSRACAIFVVASLGLWANGWAQTSPIEKRIAACAACHGRQGVAANSEFFPRLAGKPAGYLYNQLVSFRDGRRFNTDMTYLVQHLSDGYLREMADYYANLELPYPQPLKVRDVSDEVLERGRNLVFKGDESRGIPACAACHGTALMGVQPGIPALIGLPRLYLSSQLGAWLTDARHALAPDCMREVGRRLTSTDITAVANWLAMQPVPVNSKAAASLPSPLPLPCGSMQR